MRKTQAETLTYEGRPYAKQDEELVDQGLQFDIGTLLSRRGVLFAGAGAAVAGLAACGTDVGDATESSSTAASSAKRKWIPEKTLASTNSLAAFSKLVKDRNTPAIGTASESTVKLEFSPK